MQLSYAYSISKLHLVCIILLQGGVIALQIATHYGDRVRNVIIVDSSAPHPKKLVDPSLDFFKALAELSKDNAPELPLHLWEGENEPSQSFPDTPRGNAALCRYVHLYRAMPNYIFTAAQFNREAAALLEAFKSSEIYDRLESIKNPTLMVVGTKQGAQPACYLSS